MSDSKLPERPSLEYLKKLAKDRLHELRRSDPRAQLAAALLAVARDHGFPSWRALKAEVDRRQTDTAARFVEACAEGNTEALRHLLAEDPHLIRATDPNAHHPGWTGLHAASRHGRTAAVRLLLDHGADPNAREAGDNTTPLHWAAAHGHLDAVRALLDAGGDVHGFGDVHEADVIGWATSPIGSPSDTTPPPVRQELIALLLERGARHHIFSAISIGGLDVIRALVEQNPASLDRRMSRFEQKQTALHYAISRKRYDILELLIELGADLEAADQNHQTALAVAMVRGDREAMTRLNAAGALPPPVKPPSAFRETMAGFAGSVRRLVPSIRVPDIARALDWYRSIGFTEVGRYADGEVVWGMVSFGQARIAFDVGGKADPHDVSLWFEVDRIEPLYQVLKSRQLAAAQAVLADPDRDAVGIEFAEELYDPFYGGRQFSIRDRDGYTLVFLQPEN
jgi:ankyrin repeat protein